ncbi:MAG: NADPH-dependent FMN reductase [Chthoniobacterales bacterium]
MANSDKIKINILCGTNRPGSNTRIISQNILNFVRATGAEAELTDLLLLPPEIFEPTSYAEKPAGFAPFADAVLSSDGLYVVTPEYNGGVPGILKYFIDMLPFPESFEGRPVAFTGLAAGQWGALRPVEQLQSIFGYRNAHVFPERVFLPRVSGLLSENGELEERSAKRLQKQACNFIAFVKRLKVRH